MIKANTYCSSCDSQDRSSLIILTHVIHTNTITGIYIYIYIYIKLNLIFIYLLNYYYKFIIYIYIIYIYLLCLKLFITRLAAVYTYFYTHFLVALGLCCCMWAFSSCSEQGLFFIAIRGLLIAVVSLDVEHRL